MGNGLVLGGGGAVGVAWEIGLLVGLAEGGIRVQDADWILGTSAGSFVGALLAAGLSPAEIIERQASAATQPNQGSAPSESARPDAAKLAQVFRVWAESERLDTETRRKIAQLSVELAGDRVNPLLGWVSRTLRLETGHETGHEAWPARFEATAVETETGDFEVFGAASGASLDAAVAASCAVPGIFPPVEVGGLRYVDGGVRSGTSADVLIPRKPDHVLIIAPLSDASSPSLGKVMNRCMEAEIRQLADAGIATTAIVPNAADRAAFGPNMMDGSRSTEARAAGRTRGLTEATSETLAPWR